MRCPTFKFPDTILLLVISNIAIGISFNTWVISVGTDP